MSLVSFLSSAVCILLARLNDNTIQNPDFHHLHLFKPRCDCCLRPHQLRQGLNLLYACDFSIFILRHLRSVCFQYRKLPQHRIQIFYHPSRSSTYKLQHIIDNGFYKSQGRALQSLFEIRIRGYVSLFPLRWQLVRFLRDLYL
jgi:hypothetical protein